MAQYEIRIVKPNGAHSLVYACELLNDGAVIRASEAIARERSDTIEIWDGMRCVHRTAEFARTG